VTYIVKRKGDGGHVGCQLLVVVAPPFAVPDLQVVANTDDRDRSYVINRIIREWAQAKGTPIPSSTKNGQELKSA